MQTWIDTKDWRDQVLVNMWVKINPFVFSLKNLKINDLMQNNVFWGCNLCSCKMYDNNSTIQEGKVGEYLWKILMLYMN